MIVDCLNRCIANILKFLRIDAPSRVVAEDYL